LRGLDIKLPSVFDFKLGSDLNGFKEAELNMEYDKFCDVMVGDKQFLKPRVLSFWDNVTVPVTEKRKSDYYFEFPMQESCVTAIDLPQGYEVESLPPNAMLKFTYGSYNLTYVYEKNKNQVVSTAKFVLNNQVIPAARYTEMQQYMVSVARAQNKKLVIHKKD
jgi:hypothetical protein